MCLLLFSGALPNAKRAFTGSVDSLISEVKFKPYWDWPYHVDGLLSFVTHTARAALNLLQAASYFMSGIFNPFEWLLLPGVVGCHLAAAAVSVVAAVVQPIIFTVRTLLSAAFGYLSNTQYTVGDWNTDEDTEENDTAATLRIFSPSEDALSERMSCCFS